MLIPLIPNPWYEYGLVRGLKMPARTNLIPRVFKDFTKSKKSSSFSIAQDPAIITFSFPPIRLPLML